ncbi:MAG: hypothetical protein O3A00_25145 [Planctomycetota bacterium]|nr:hypothetical protein [Planctomycetota bacterium]
MPSYLPLHSELVYLSGVCEIVLGVLILIPGYSTLAAWGIVTLLIAVFPANLCHLWSVPTSQPSI